MTEVDSPQILQFKIESLPTENTPVFNIGIREKVIKVPADLGILNRDHFIAREEIETTGSFWHEDIPYRDDPEGRRYRAYYHNEDKQDKNKKPVLIVPLGRIK